MRYLMRLALALIVTLLAVAGFAPAVSASGGARFGLQPVSYDKNLPATQSYFVFDAAPGTTVESQVRVVNSGTAAGTVRLYTVDATTGQTSGTVFLNESDPRRDAGGWVALDVSQLALQPGEGVVVPFTVTIPADAQPGEHVGGIVAQDVALQQGEERPAGPEGANFRVDIQNLTILAVQVNLPGPMAERVEVTGISAGGTQGYQKLFVGLRNTGTRMVKPTGTIIVADTAGREVQRIALKLDTFLPRTEIQYPVFVERQALGAGAYNATVQLDYGTGGMVAYEGTFTVTQEQVSQVFRSVQPLAPPPGAAAPAPAPQGTSASSLLRQVWSAVAGAAIALALGATLFLFWQRRAATRRG